MKTLIWKSRLQKEMTACMIVEVDIVQSSQVYSKRLAE